MLSWLICYFLQTSQTIRTNGHQLCQENTCASHNHGAQFYFWELRGAYFFLHLDSYVYEKRVELMYDINYQQTTNAKLGLARILPTRYVRTEQPRGSVFSWELRDVYFI
jgi:hypothetical protein